MRFMTRLRLRNVYRGLQILFLLVVPSICKTCQIEYQNQLFDFSGLALKPWNVSGITEDNVGLVHASISLCNHSHESPCGNVNFCIMDEDYSKWISFNNTLIVPESKNFKISFSLRKMSSNSVINAEIKLNCSNEIGEPKFQEFKENRLIILWETLAACKIKYPDPYRRCVIRNDDIGEVNLQSLRHLHYYNTVDNNQNKYYINVCGGTVSNSTCPSEKGNVAACAIDSSNKSIILGLASKQLVVEKKFILQFRNSSKKIFVEIELICNSRVHYGELKFKSVEGERRIFELETSLVCLKKLPHCRVSDKDHYKYDLSSLSGQDYEVYDTQRNKYILSVCKSVNNKICSGGASVCFQNGTSSLNMGFLGSGPEIIDEENGVLQISSSGGSYCNSKLRYKSVIIFKCSKKHSHPTFRGITANCVYTFEWYTKTACPFMAEVGNNCQVRDPALGYNFNLNSLRKNNEDYILNGNDGEKFHLNLCGGLVKPCDGSKDVGVCLLDFKGAQHKIGEVANLPHYDDGRLSFELTGEACTSSGTSSKVIIIFTCNHAAELSYPSLFEKFENCTYIFLWPTTKACPEFTVHKCQVSNENGDKYDLSPLSLFDKDYTVCDNKTNIQRQYTINICQPVIFGNESRCSSETGVCVQDMTEPVLHKSFTSLGLATGLQFDKVRNILKVVYDNGGLCDAKGKSERLSEIIFICDREAIVPVVQFVNESDCVHEFLMKTKHACPISSELKEFIHKEKSCKVHNTFTDLRVDFSQFAGQEYLLNDTVGGNYKFTICGSLNNVSLPGIGMCRETATDCENLGIGNSNLRYEAGKLFLNYTDGVNCSKTAKSYTLIEFKCNRENEGIHLLTSSNSCKFSVIWYTSMACVVPCKTDGAIEVSLSFFSSYERNYNTSVNGVDYFINVCKPLVNQDGLNCYPGSAVCRAVPGKTNEWTKEVNLGFSHHRPILMDDKIVLNYSSNVHCPNNESHYLTSSIHFECDPMVGIGSPVLMQLMNECHYEFLWKTSVVCPNYKIQVGALYTGVIINNQSNTVLDLQPICRNKRYMVGNYVISVCDSLFEVTKVEKERKISYGRANNILFNYSENMTQLLISQGDECLMNSEENYYAIINLLCSSKADAHPHILKETNCNVHFEWKTSAACAQHISSDAIGATTNPTAKSSIGTLGVIFSILLTVVASLGLLCIIRYSKIFCCRRYINRFLSRRHQGNIHYSLSNADSYDFEISSEEHL